MSNRKEGGLIDLDEGKFIKAMAGQDLAITREQRGAVLGLTNLHDAGHLEKSIVHPLAFSPDYKKHPDMICIPSWYKFSRNFEEKYREVRALPKN